MLRIDREVGPVMGRCCIMLLGVMCEQWRSPFRHFPPLACDAQY